MEIWQNDVSGTREPRMGNTRRDKEGLQTCSKDKEVINTQVTNTMSMCPGQEETYILHEQSQDRSLQVVSSGPNLAPGLLL